MDILPRKHTQHRSEAGYKVLGKSGGARKQEYIIKAIKRGFGEL